MEEGAIVKVAFIQADKTIKYRPALLLKKTPPFNDWLVCAISSQLWAEVKGLDIVLNENHSDYVLSGLKYPGVIRLAWINTFAQNFIEGSIGNISQKTLIDLQSILAKFLTSK